MMPLLSLKLAEFNKEISSSCLLLQSYADGSQYMASHDNLSPPYTNSRLTGNVSVKCLSQLWIHCFVSMQLCVCVCVWACVPRNSATLVCTGGDRSSGMWFLSLFLLPRPAVWKNARQCVLIYPWCSLPLALSNVAPVVSKWPLTQIICASLFFSQSHTHTVSQSLKYRHADIHACRRSHRHRNYTELNYLWLDASNMEDVSSQLSNYLFSYCHSVSRCSFHLL